MVHIRSTILSTAQQIDISTNAQFNPNLNSNISSFFFHFQTIIERNILYT